MNTQETPVFPGFFISDPPSRYLEPLPAGVERVSKTRLAFGQPVAGRTHWLEWVGGTPSRPSPPRAKPPSSRPWIRKAGQATKAIKATKAPALARCRQDRRDGHLTAPFDPGRPISWPVGLTLGWLWRLRCQAGIRVRPIGR